MTRIFVEVTEDEATCVATWLRQVDDPMRHDAIQAMIPTGVSEQRLADRFTLAATNSDEPVRFMGEAVFIQREMT